MLCSRNQITCLLLATFVVSIIDGPQTPAQVFASPMYHAEMDKDVLISFDREVTQFYEEDYPQLDARNDSYDDYLYRSIRSIRHSHVNSLWEYAYSDEAMIGRAHGPQVNEELCLEQLEYLAQASEGHAKGSRWVPLSVANFFETSGSVKPGVMNGNHVWLGHEIGCQFAKIPAQLSTRLRHNLDGQSNLTTTKQTYALRQDIHGRYCVAHIKAKSWPHRDPFYFDRLTIKLGVCLPQTCHTITYRKSGRVRQLIDQVARHNLRSPFNSDRYRVVDLYCFPDDQSPMRTRGIGATLFYASLGLWLCLNLYVNLIHDKGLSSSSELSSSTQDEQDKQAKLAKRSRTTGSWLDRLGFVEAMSWQSNWNHLFGRKPDQRGLVQTNESKTTTSATPSRVSFDVIDGLRALTSAYMVFGHVMVLYYSQSEDMKLWINFMHDRLPVMLMNAHHLVNLFYILSGCLLTYLVMVRQTKRQMLNPMFWALVIIMRYVRLLPVYALVVWYAKSLSSTMGSGHGWIDYRTDNWLPRSYCDQETWTGILMLSEQKHNLHACIPQAWYIAADFKALFLLPAFIMMLVVNPVIGLMIIALCIGGSNLHIRKLLAGTKLDFNMFVSRRPHTWAVLLARTGSIYQDPLARLGPYLVGVVAGYVLYLYHKGTIAKWPVWFRKGLFRLSVFLLVANILAPAPDTMVDPNVSAEKAITFFIAAKCSYELILAVVVIGLATGLGDSFVRYLLSCRVAKFFAQISFCVFLVHVEIMYNSNVVRSETSYQLFALASTYFVVVSHFAAFLLHFFFEMPITNLLRGPMKRILGKM